MQRTNSGNGSTRLMILEDNESQLQTLTALMCREGFHVSGFSVAQDALDHLAKEPADVAIVDLQLPDLRESVLLAQLKTFANDVSIIVNTGFGSYSTAKEALNIGAFAYLEKASDPAALIGEVYRAVESRLRKRTEELEDTVTDRTQELEKANRINERSATEWSSTFDATQDAIMVLDAEGYVTRANQAAAHFYEIDVIEIVGMHCREFSDKFPESLESSPFQTMLETRTRAQTETRLKSDRWFSVVIDPIRDENGNIVGAIHSSRDISEHKTAEETLRQSEAELRAIFEGSPTMMIVVDSDHNIRKANQAALDFSKRPENEILGVRSGDALQCVSAGKDSEGCGSGPACHACPIRCAVDETFRTATSFNVREATFWRGDSQGAGERRIVHVSTHVFSVIGEQLVLVCVQDITDRKQAEAEAQAAHELLLVQQQREKQRIEQANWELERRNRELQDFVHVSSHDLRAPLVNIRGFADILASQCDRARSIVADSSADGTIGEALNPLLSEDIPESLSFIQMSADKMNALLSGLLNISRVGSAALTVKRLDMNQLIAELLGSMRYALEQSGALVQVSALPPCRGDGLQTGQVFSNLLDNALKYLDAERAGVIRVSGREKGGESVYCVEDNGIGISSEDQEAVFRLFQRLDPDHGEGLGLGLTLVRRIVDRQGGTILLESIPGEGSRFFITLPTD
jgi:PAS domain S-box-containing protein